MSVALLESELIWDKHFPVVKYVNKAKLQYVTECTVANIKFYAS